MNRPIWSGVAELRPPLVTQLTVVDVSLLQVSQKWRGELPRDLCGLSIPSCIHDCSTGSALAYSYPRRRPHLAPHLSPLPADGERRDKLWQEFFLLRRHNHACARDRRVPSDSIQLACVGARFSLRQRVLLSAKGAMSGFSLGHRPRCSIIQEHSAESAIQCLNPTRTARRTRCRACAATRGNLPETCECDGALVAPRCISDRLGASPQATSETAPSALNACAKEKTSLAAPEPSVGGR